MHSDAVAVDEVAAFPAAVKQDQHHDARQIDSGGIGEAWIVEAQHQVDELDHDFTWERTDKADALREAAGVSASVGG